MSSQPPELFKAQSDQRGLVIVAPHPPSGGRLFDACIFVLHTQNETNFHCPGSDGKDYHFKLPEKVLKLTGIGLVLADEMETWSE